jgi:rSAM/selenodomain-associated transferase 1
VSENCCLVLFTKPSVAGRVKTRLIGTLTPDEAARLHAAFLDDIIERMVGGRFDFQIAWGVEPGEDLPSTSISGFRQSAGTLGERILHGLRRAGLDHSLVAAVGSDHLSVSTERISEAFELLRGRADIVIGPATDGGYYLLAARAESLVEELFAEIPWSSPKVLSITLQRCAELGLKVHLLPPESDVDTSTDLDRLCSELQEGHFESPQTYALLAEWGKIDTRSRIL